MCYAPVLLCEPLRHDVSPQALCLTPPTPSSPSLAWTVALLLQCVSAGVLVRPKLTAVKHFNGSFKKGDICVTAECRFVCSTCTVFFYGCVVKKPFGAWWGECAVHRLRLQSQTLSLCKKSPEARSAEVRLLYFFEVAVFSSLFCSRWSWNIVALRQTHPAWRIVTVFTLWFPAYHL